jgi:hypothetical protein
MNTKEPVYLKREELTRLDRLKTINRLQKEIASEQKHLDAFRAWHEQCCRTERDAQTKRSQKSVAANQSQSNLKG